MAQIARKYWERFT